MFEVHVLASGSDGNCTVIQCDDEAVMIDAGVSCKKILSYMDQEGVDPGIIKALLITHEHSDHIMGAGPVARKLKLPVYCNRPTYDASNMGSVEYNEIHTSGSFIIGNMSITPLPTSHNAAEPNAFLIEEDGRKALLATDTGKMTFQVEKALSECDIAVIESNYDQKMLTEGPYPYYLKKIIGSDVGHLSNIDCAEALKRTDKNNRKIFLAHLSKTNNTPDVAREEVAKITGIRRMNLDCLEFQGDTRTIKF
jgi:phosphoribosyl 1,2-cyclic phosphodiesterase